MQILDIITPIGKMIACTNKDGLCLLEFFDRKDIAKRLAMVEHYFGEPLEPGSSVVGTLLQQQLNDYFEGIRSEFTIPLVLWGTHFQRTVWECLQGIHCGSVLTYSQEAHSVHNPKGVRAVAQANAQNRIALLIPCHRVVLSSGKIGGYAGYTWRKEWLLKHEASMGAQK